MRYSLRTLLIACAILPLAAGLFWWYVGTVVIWPYSLPLAITFAALAIIAVSWLCELADYLSRLTRGRR